MLILRTTTERCEIIWEGTGTLVGTDHTSIIKALDAWLATPQPLTSQHHIYGDGHASERIAKILLQHTSQQPASPSKLTNTHSPKASIPSKGGFDS
jgi:UDP-N-acetylglucosamine 2-epimerase